MGLNGDDKPITITLPELLHSSASTTTNEHPYMKIDIPLPPPEKPRISIATEANDLLTWVMVDESSHELEHSPVVKAATAEAVMSPSHKSEAPLLPVDTSSQASMEEGKASLEGIPANVSPTAAAHSSSSTSPQVDPTKLQTNANLATNHMLCVKRSTDLKRQ